MLADIELANCGQYNRLVDVAVVVLLSIMMAMMTMMQPLKSEKLMVLKIDRVFKQHFRQYYFHAFNEAGSNEVKLILDRRGQLHLLTCSASIKTSWITLGLSIMSKAV